jgi:hypothetical protein
VVSAPLRRDIAVSLPDEKSAATKSPLTTRFPVAIINMAKLIIIISTEKQA